MALSIGELEERSFKLGLYFKPTTSVMQFTRGAIFSRPSQPSAGRDWLTALLRRTAPAFT